MNRWSLLVVFYLLVGLLGVVLGGCSDDDVPTKDVWIFNWEELDGQHLALAPLERSEMITVLYRDLDPYFREFLFSGKIWQINNHLIHPAVRDSGCVDRLQGLKIDTTQENQIVASLDIDLIPCLESKALGEVKFFHASFHYRMVVTCDQWEDVDWTQQDITAIQQSWQAHFPCRHSRQLTYAWQQKYHFDYETKATFVDPIAGRYLKMIQVGSSQDLAGDPCTVAVNSEALEWSPRCMLGYVKRQQQLNLRDQQDADEGIGAREIIQFRGVFHEVKGYQDQDYLASGRLDFDMNTITGRVAFVDYRKMGSQVNPPIIDYTGE